MNQYTETSVRSVQPILGPDGLQRYSLTFDPTNLAPDRPYGAQATIDSFWPIGDDGAPPEPVNGEVWVPGILGDPSGNAEAILVGIPTGREFGLRSVRLIELTSYTSAEAK